MEYTIYSITCKDVEVTGVYVWSTHDFVQRKCKHRSDSQDETKKHRKVYKIINCNGGISNWEFNILEIFKCDSQYEAFIRERFILTSCKPI